MEPGWPVHEVLGHGKVWREGELARPDPMQLLDDAKEDRAVSKLKCNTGFKGQNPG